MAKLLFKSVRLSSLTDVNTACETKLNKHEESGWKA